MAHRPPLPAEHRPLQGEDDVDVAGKLHTRCDQEAQVEILAGNIFLDQGREQGEMIVQV